VKQEPAAARPKRVKREAGGGADPAGPSQMEVDGRAVAEDEYALCDLSQAENVPGWSVHKRQAQPVEELEA
jgi:hypothetical protein